MKWFQINLNVLFVIILNNFYGYFLCIFSRGFWLKCHKVLLRSMANSKVLFWGIAFDQVHSKRKTNKMADEKRDENEAWKTFAKGMKEKRTKKAAKSQGHGKGTGVGENILSEKEMIVQRLASEASGKAMKYERLGPQEFVTYSYDEVSLENIKRACYFHFRDRLTNSDMVCDILATQNGPSCTKLSHK